ncbi:MAG: 50S ribosomal protein L19 [Candidatus Levybacteria bacterium]|nr:50S ribosomal protein L19 [Candidatus Levybacteria bacterium]
MISTIDFAAGDVVRVHQKIQEGEKTRTQVFQGTVIQIRGRGNDKSFTVRKVVQGVGVEKIWQIASPTIEKVEIKEHPKNRIRRARITYIRKSSKFSS